MRFYAHLALCYLKKQKGRTFAMTLGIALSVMLIFGFNIIRESQSKNQLANIYNLYGSYHGFYNNLDLRQVNSLKNDRNIAKVISVANLGNAITDNGISIKLFSSNKDFMKTLGYKFKIGRMPKTKDEIVLDDFTLKNLKLKEEINQIIKLNIKKDYKDENGINQIFMTTKKFKLVGIIKNPIADEEAYNTLRGFTFFKLGQNNVILNKLVKYFTVVKLKSKNIQLFQLNRIREKYNIGRLDFDVNNQLLKALNDFNLSQSNLRIMVIKILIIITSILLIYNIFNISLTIVIQQIGVLRAIGASKKQVRKILVLQSFFLLIMGTIIGLVMGLIFSIIGIQIFNFTSTTVVHGGALQVSANSFNEAVKLSVITVIISTIIPLWSAGRISPLEAIKKSDRSNTKQKNRTHHKIIKKCIGIIGEMAYKNIWRNKFRTIISIVSISISGIVYLVLIAVANNPTFSNISLDVQKMGDVQDKLYFQGNIYENFAGYTEHDLKNISNIKGVINADGVIDKEVFYSIPLSILTKNYVKYNAISTNSKVVEAIANVKGYDFGKLNKLSKYIEMGEISNQSSKIYPNVAIVNYYYAKVSSQKIQKISNLKVGDIVTLKIPKIEGKKALYKMYKVRVGALLKRDWIFKGDSTNGRYFEIILPKTILMRMTGGKYYSAINLKIKSGTYEYVSKKIKSLLKDKPFVKIQSKEVLINQHKSDIDSGKKQNMIIILMILFVGVLNIFNTIRINLLIRFNEFGMLRAIGMTVRQMKSLIYKEAAFYGIISSIISALIGTYLNYKVISKMQSFGEIKVNFIKFQIPFLEILEFSFVAISVCMIAAYGVKKKFERFDIIEAVKETE